jgi:peroxiredoxin (alkyl hydroperoxide reductase subunit C)
MAAVAVKYPAFKELGAEVLAISVDPIDVHREWQKKDLVRLVKGGVRFPMLSDPGGSLGRLYGMYNENTKTDLRGHFLIDPQGIIQIQEILPDQVGRNVTEILRQLRALQHYRKTGRFIPCGWQPGRPTVNAESRTRNQKAPGEWKTRHAF